MRVITSFSNPAIKALRALGARHGRRDSGGLFLGEGMRVVREALALGWMPQQLVFLDGQYDAIKNLLAETRITEKIDCIGVSEAILAKISRKDNPQMVVGCFKERWCAPQAILRGNKGCVIGLDRIRDPGNLGAIMRTADAVGAAGIVLIGDCCDAYSVECVRASMGAIFNMRIGRMGADEFIAFKKEARLKVIATALGADTQDYRDADWGGALMLLMGNEQAGLPQELLEIADVRVGLPMLGRSDSLNVAVATGVCLYAHLAANHGSSGRK